MNCDNLTQAESPTGCKCLRGRPIKIVTMGAKMADIQGTPENDTLAGDTGDNRIFGEGGNDQLTHTGTSGLMGLYGGNGNDVLTARYLNGSKSANAQFHLYGGSGDDSVNIDLRFLSSASGHQGHHIYGGHGRDTFNFTNHANTQKTLIGRIDDFDYSRDKIRIAGVDLDLFDADDLQDKSASIVLFNGQQWLRVGNNALYALEGARYGGSETHFTTPEIGGVPIDLDDLVVVPFVDQMNWVPHSTYASFEADLDDVDVDVAPTNSNGSLYRIINGTLDNNFFYDDVVNQYDNNDHGHSGGTQTQTANARIYGGVGNDVIDAGKGNDTAYGGDGNDLIAGGQDIDILYGQNGNDQVWGGSENDTLYGGNDQDSLRGGTGNDQLWGENGNDQLEGNYGNDTLYGGAGNDSLYGNNENDRLEGGANNDVVSGQAGADTLYGGSGTDRFIGGVGVDQFCFITGDLMDWDTLTGTTDQRNALLDVITDFQLSGDKINLSGFAGVDSVADLMIFQTVIAGNTHFTIKIDATNERFLVDVPEGTTYSQMAAASNFIF